MARSLDNASTVRPIRKGPTSLVRGLRILAAFMDRRLEWGVRELATELKMHPSSVQRGLQALASESFLQYDPDLRKYHVGLGLYRMSSIVQQKLPLAQAAQPIMRALVSECDETVLLGLYSETDSTVGFVHQVESRHPLRYVIEFGNQHPIHLGSAGRAIMAVLDDSLIERLLAEPLARFTKHTLTDPRRIRKTLAHIRRVGYSTSKGESIPGAVGIASAVWNARGIVGCLNVTMPESRYKAGRERIVGPLIRAAAQQLSSALGGKDTPPRAD